MKNSLVIFVSTAVLVMLTATVFAQQTTELPAKIAERNIVGAQIGMVMCEDAGGNTVPCTGSLEESILGIVTNVPYVTFNKPTSKDGSRFIFDSFVAAENGVISKGDYLTAGSNGNFVKTEVLSLAYAIALESVESGQRTIKVKVLK
jgi:hypothetical protein